MKQRVKGSFVFTIGFLNGKGDTALHRVNCGSIAIADRFVDIFFNGRNFHGVQILIVTGLLDVAIAL